MNMRFSTGNGTREVAAHRGAGCGAAKTIKMPAHLLLGQRNVLQALRLEFFLQLDVAGAQHLVGVAEPLLGHRACMACGQRQCAESEPPRVASRHKVIFARPGANAGAH